MVLQGLRFKVHGLQGLHLGFGVYKFRAPVCEASGPLSALLVSKSAVLDWLLAVIKDSFRWVVTRWVPLKEAYIDLVQPYLKLSLLSERDETCNHVNLGVMESLHCMAKVRRRRRM